MLLFDTSKAPLWIGLAHSTLVVEVLSIRHVFWECVHKLRIGWVYIVLNPECGEPLESTHSRLLTRLGFVRWRTSQSIYFYTEEWFSAPQQFQIKPSLPSLRVYRSADPTFQWFSGIVWYIPCGRLRLWEWLLLMQWVQVLEWHFPFQS